MVFYKTANFTPENQAIDLPSYFQTTTDQVSKFLTVFPIVVVWLLLLSFSLGLTLEYCVFAPVL